MAKDTILTVNERTQLLPFLLANFPNKGRNKVKMLLTRGQVMVENRIVTRHDHPLEANQTVKVLGMGTADRESMHGVRILFEDDDIIVIDKPPGLLSIATEEERTLTAYHILTDHVRVANPRARIFVVHRLDRETSGIMMFAKREEVQQTLQSDWRDMVQERAYVVLVEGRVNPLEGTIETWLKESSTRTMYVSRPGDGVKALTEYKVLDTGGDFTLLEVHLQTGKKNQIRVHMQHIGHSVVGDRRYGARKNPIGRLGLHARVLAFTHPKTGEVLRFETRIPPTFKAALSRKQ